MNNKTDLEFIQRLLPEYDCEEKKIGEIRCKSYIGMADEKDWLWFKNKVIIHFKNRFSEFYHEVNYRHKDFFVYYNS